MSERFAFDGIGAAVIGGGFVGRVHLDALRRLGVPVRGVLTSTAQRSLESAARMGVPRGYASLDELLADPAVHVVHVASPNDLHADQVSAVLESGRHVVCEKPLALSGAESARLVRLAERSGLVHAMCFNLRYYQLNLQAAATIARGDIGGVRLVSGSYLQDWLLHDRDWNWRLDPERGGTMRVVGDIGSHWLDLATMLSGLRIEQVFADLATFLPRRWRPMDGATTFSGPAAGRSEQVEVTTEDVATVLLRFEGGARGAVVLSQVSAGRKNSLRYQVDGSIASLAWDSEQPDQLWIGHRDQGNEIILRNAALSEGGGAAPRLPAGHVEGYADTFRALFAEVYGAIAGGAPRSQPAYPTLADGLRTILVGEAIAESARSGRWTPVTGYAGEG